MQKFEATLLFSPDLTKESLNKSEDFFKNELSKYDGSIKADEDWGLKELAYNIDNHKKAFYKYYQIEIEGKKIQEIKNSLNKHDDLIRYLFVKVDNHEELPTKMMNKES